MISTPQINIVTADSLGKMSRSRKGHVRSETSEQHYAQTHSMVGENGRMPHWDDCRTCARLFPNASSQWQAGWCTAHILTIQDW